MDNKEKKYVVRFTGEIAFWTETEAEAMRLFWKKFPHTTISYFFDNIDIYEEEEDEDD
jgi:hypothetical protein